MSNVVDMTLNDEHTQALGRADLTVREAKAMYDHARQHREREIRRVAADGGTYREISSVSGVSYQRVAQIVTGKEIELLSWKAPLEIDCPTCEAKAGEWCVDVKGQFHGERSDKRMDMFRAEHPEIGL